MDEMIEERPLLSIIMPVYNVSQYLKRSLDSIIAQTYTNLEIILIDDGSSDGTESICDDYAALDSRIKVIHRANGGVSSARNIALDNMSGELVGFVDGDDYVEPDFYSCLYTQLVLSGADIAACGTQVIADTYTRLYTPPTDEVCSAEQLFEMYLVDKYKVHFMMHAIWNRLYKRSVFDGLRFNEGLTTASDRAIFPKLLLAAKNGIKFCPQVHYTYYKREGSLVTSGDHVIEKDIQSAAIYYEAIAEAFPRLAQRAEYEKEVTINIMQIERIHYSVICNTKCIVKMTPRMAWTAIAHGHGQDRALALALFFIKPISRSLYIYAFDVYCKMMSKRSAL